MSCVVKGLGDCDGLLIDLDGTLIDSSGVIADIWCQVLHNSGRSADAPMMRELVRGNSGRDITAALGLGGQEVDWLLAEVEALEQRAYYPAARSSRSFLLRARSVCARVGLVTSSWRAKTSNVLRDHDWATLFDIVVTRDDVRNVKPDPEPYLEGIRRLALPRNVIVAVEDSAPGVQAAIAAGLRCILVSVGSRSLSADVLRVGNLDEIVFSR